MIARIRDSAARRGVTRLCHFTPSRNLVHIAAGLTGILATARLAEQERAAYTATDGDSSFRDSGIGHTDNYEDPGNSETDARYPDVANPWRFRYDCLAFDVLSMLGDTEGPATADGDLTGDVAFRISQGCGAFDYGYGAADTIDAAPVAKFSVRPKEPTVGDRLTLSAGSSTDDRTDPDKLSYSWDFGNGGSREDATGQVASIGYKKVGKYLVTLTVTDAAGNSDTLTKQIRVRR